MKILALIFFITFGFLNANEDLKITKSLVLGLSWNSKIEDFEKKFGKPKEEHELADNCILKRWHSAVWLKFDLFTNSIISVHISDNPGLAGSIIFKDALRENLQNNKMDKIEIAECIELKCEISKIIDKYGESDFLSDKFTSYQKEIDGLFYFIKFSNNLVEDVTIKKNDLKIFLLNDSSFIDHKSIFGLPWSSKIKEIEAKIGNCTGKLFIKNGNTIYLWGNTLAIEYSDSEEKVINIELSLNMIAGNCLSFQSTLPNHDLRNIKICQELYLGQDINQTYNLLGSDLKETFEKKEYPYWLIAKKSIDSLKVVVTFVGFEKKRLKGSSNFIKIARIKSIKLTRD